MKRTACLLLALTLVMAGCASVQTGSSYSPKQLQDMGEKYLAAGDTATALKYLTEADQKLPDNPVLQYDLGLAYNQRGMPDKALAFLQKALKIKPQYPEALNAIGTVYADRGQVELAQEAFQKAQDDPFYHTPQLSAYNLGRLFEKKGDPERALAQYRQAVKFDPNYGPAWYRIGHILETMNKGDEARHSYGKAVATSPDLAEAHLRYGIMSYLAGDMEAALFSLSRVGRIAPNTDMADQARKYLENFRGITPERIRPGGFAAVSPTEVEVISNGQLQRKAQRQTAPPPIVKMQPTLDPEPRAAKPQQPPARTEPPAPATVPDSAGVGHEPVVEQQPSFKYIVQVGSFVDREKAEEFRKNLREKGYSAVVRSLKHQVLGRVFVIQLKPVGSISKATTLMTQMGSEAKGEPVIIKVPVENKAPVEKHIDSESSGDKPAAQ